MPRAVRGIQRLDDSDIGAVLLVDHEGEDFQTIPKCPCQRTRSLQQVFIQGRSRASSQSRNTRISKNARHSVLEVHVFLEDQNNFDQHKRFGVQGREFVEERRFMKKKGGKRAFCVEQGLTEEHECDRSLKMCVFETGRIKQEFFFFNVFLSNRKRGVRVQL